MHPLLCNQLSFQNTWECYMQEVLQIKGSFIVQEYHRGIRSFLQGNHIFLHPWGETPTSKQSFTDTTDGGFKVSEELVVAMAGCIRDPSILNSFVIPSVYHSLQLINAPTSSSVRGELLSSGYWCGAGGERPHHCGPGPPAAGSELWGQSLFFPEQTSHKHSFYDRFPNIFSCI